jgi:hypothetical protein
MEHGCCDHGIDIPPIDGAGGGGDLSPPSDTGSGSNKGGGRRGPYDEERIKYIRLIYALALFVWALLVWMFSLWRTDGLGWIILAIPIAVFLFGYVNAANVTIEVENELFRANYLAIGLLIVLPLLTWFAKDYAGDKRQFISVIVMAVMLSMMSLIDFWVPIHWLSVVKHSKSVLQTMSLGLLIFAVYTYYVTTPHAIFK